MGLTEQATPTDRALPIPHMLGRSVAIDQAAQLLGVSRRTIYNRIRDGRLETIRTLGGSQRVTVESLYHLGFKPQPTSSSASAAMTGVARLERGSR